MKCIIGMGLMAMAMVSAAQAQADFCADVRSVAAAAHETTPFASVPRLPDRRAMLGHRACFFAQAPGVGFIRWFDESACVVCDLPPDLLRDRGWTNREDLMSRIAACLPRALRSGPEYRDSAGSALGRQLSAGRPRYPYYSSVYVDSGPLRFEYGTLHHSRFDRGWLNVYVRDAEGTGRPIR